MARVRDIMNKDVPRVSRDATVLDAARLMNEKRSSGIAIEDEERIVGVLTDRRLLTTFVPMNKEPGKVKVSEVMAPIYRIAPDATPKEAARKIIRLGITRLGVFEGERFLGWVSLTDLSREFSKKNLMDTLEGQEEPEGPEFLCSNCKSGFMIPEIDGDGNIVSWRCPKCGTVM